MMDVDEAIKTLEIYNKWRRGDDSYTMGCVKKLGQAIDYAIDYMKQDPILRLEMNKIKEKIGFKY